MIAWILWILSKGSQNALASLAPAPQWNLATLLLLLFPIIVLFLFLVWYAPQLRIKYSSIKRPVWFMIPPGVILLFLFLSYGLLGISSVTLVLPSSLIAPGGAQNGWTMHHTFVAIIIAVLFLLQSLGLYSVRSSGRHFDWKTLLWIHIFCILFLFIQMYIGSLINTSFMSISLLQMLPQIYYVILIYRLQRYRQNRSAHHNHHNGHHSRSRSRSRSGSDGGSGWWS